MSRRFPLVLAVQIPPGSALHWTENLSAGGLFVRTDQPFTSGERLTLSLAFPGLDEHVELEVQVVRRRGEGSEGPPGVALVVPDDRPASLQRLAALAQAAEQAESSRQPYRVLLVEDNHLVAAMYTSALRRLADKEGFSGLQIEHLLDGAAAIERLARPPSIDVMITDVYMPVMSGFALLEQVRANPATKDVPVVVISSGSKREHDDALRLGAQYFLPKPVKYHDLVAVVRTLLTAAACRAMRQP